MKIYFYNLKEIDFSTIHNFNKKELESAHIDAIHVVYLEKDNDENRMLIRKTTNTGNSWVILISNSAEISSLAWKTDVHYFIKSDKVNKELPQLIGYAIQKLIEKKNRLHEKKLRIKSLNRIDYVSPMDITYILADGNYSTIYTKDQKILISKNLKSIEEKLKDITFLNRYGKSVILNTGKITAIQGREIFFGSNKSLKFPKYSNGFTDLKNKLLWKTL